MSDGATHVRRRVVVVLVVVALTVWALAMGLTVLSAAWDLRDARSELVAAERVLRDAELADSREHLGRAVDRATRASSRLAGWHLVPLRAVPVVAQNLAAARALSDAARDVGGAASELLEVADTIVRDDRDAAVGELSVAYIREITGPLEKLAEAVHTSIGAVADTGHPRLLGPVERARATYLDLATPVSEQVEVAAELARVLPGFLGEDEPRHYLVAAASLSELRGSGGLVGSYSVMTVDEGRFDFTGFGDIDEIERRLADPAVPSPSPEYAARYGPLGGLHLWRNANLSSHFPWTADVFLQLWEQDGRAPLDGVVLADPVVFERIVERSGPIEVPGITTLTADTVRRFVGLDAYAQFDTDEERKLVLGAVATSAFERAFAILDDRDVPATVEMLVALAEGGNLRVFSRDDQVQPALERAGVAGGLPEDVGEFAAVVANNVAANKTDVFTRRTVIHHVELLPGGVTGAEITATFDNEAPGDGLPRHVLGPWADGLEAGDNLSEVTFLCGPGCSVEDAPEGAAAGGSERGHPATDLRVHVPAGERRQLRFATSTAGGWQDVRGGAELTVHHRRQPTLTDDETLVRVEVPEGFEFVHASEEVTLEGGTITHRMDREHVALHLRLVPSDAADAP